MDVNVKAAAILKEAETRLRGLMRDATEAGDYAAVMQLAEWARAVGGLIGDELPVAVSAGPKRHSAPPRRVAPLDLNGADDADGLAAAPSQNVTVKAGDNGYPRFLREGDQLVKVGWSRRLREEYQHKAPRRAVDLVVASIAKAGGNGKLIKPEQVMPVHDAADLCDVPVYQVYVTLAWLKAAGLVTAHGRSGYSIRRGQDLAGAVKSAWNKLGNE